MSIPGFAREEIHCGVRTTTDEAKRIAELERESRELQRSNEILNAASEFHGSGARPRTRVIAHLHGRPQDRLRGRADCGFRAGPVCRSPRGRTTRPNPAHPRRGRSATWTWSSGSTVHSENYGVYCPQGPCGVEPTRQSQDTVLSPRRRRIESWAGRSRSASVAGCARLRHVGDEPCLACHPDRS